MSDATSPHRSFTDFKDGLTAEALSLLEDTPETWASTKLLPPQATWLGQMDYVASIQQTQKIAGEHIWGLEYPLTITLGKRADPLKDIKASLKILREQKVEIVGVERGGQATLHNPGQLVIYPHLDLRARALKVREYVALIEAVTINFFSRFGIESFRHGNEPGIYTARGKMAFFGVRVKGGFTSHGLAINVRNALADFALIRSCGKTEETFSSMQDFAVNAPLSHLFDQWCAEFFAALDALAT